MSDNINPRPSTPVINEEVTRESDATVPVELLNNPEPLGVTIRLKDVALVAGTTVVSGLIGLNVKNSLLLFLGVMPLQAAMFYGITRSYFATRTIAISFTVTATLVSSSLTAALAFLITPQTDKHKLLFKPIAWLIEQKASDLVGTVGASVDAITPAVSATEQKLEIYVRGLTAAVVTLASGTLSTVSASILNIKRLKERI